MKRILAACLIVGLASSLASADWLADFKENYKTKNIDIAVEKAVKEGISPDLIAETSLAFENMNPQNLIKAMYCAGVTGEDVYFVAQKYNISELIVEAGFKKSVEECKDQVADTQPYTPGGRQGRGFGGPDHGDPERPFASPSRFR